MTIIWCMVPEIWSVTARIFLSFWTIFWAFFGLFFAFYFCNNLKNGNFKKMKEGKEKKCPEISFYTSVPKIMIICYTVPEIWRVTDVIVFFSFWAFFALLPPNSPNYQKLKTMRKTPGDIIILHMYQEWWLDDVQFLRYGAQQMGRQMNGQTTDRQTDGWWSDV